jgi:RecG-like helicase
MKKKAVLSYKFLIVIMVIVTMLALSLLLYKNDNFISTNNESNILSINNLAFAQSSDKDIYNKDNIKPKELKQKVHQHISKKIENDKEFWDYLKANHPNLYTSLNNLKLKYEELYNHFSFRVYTIYQSMKKTENNTIRDLLKDKLNIQDKIIKLVYDYKEKKIQENDFENQMKNYIKQLLDNDEKILTERLNEFKAKKDQVAQDMYIKIKEKLDKN